MSFSDNDTTANNCVYDIIVDSLDNDRAFLVNFYSDYMANKTSSEKELKKYVETKVLWLLINIKRAGPQGKLLLINLISNTIDYSDLLEMLINYVKDILANDFGDDTY